MRTFVCSLLFLLPALLRGQTGTEPRQIEAVDTLSTGQALPTYEDWIMVSMLDTIGVDDYRYHHARLNLPHLFINTNDSICFVLYEGADTFCVAVPEGTGVTDSTYQWILTVNGGAPDTITVNETVNLVQGTNITITQGATDVTFNVPDMRDTCLHSLTQLTDTTAQLTDCNGANRGIITFSSDQCIQDMVVANGIGSDTIFLTNCDGTNKDTVVFYPPSYNDSYIDSVRYEFGDSLTVWLLRVDTSGVIDSVPIYIPVDSINTDTQLLSYIQNGQFDTISISNGNSIYLFDQDSQSLNITDDTLYISRGNNVDLKPYLDNDTVPDYDFLIIGSNRVPDQPADIDSAIYTGTGPSKRVRIGQDSLETGFNVLINGGAGPLETASSLSANLWRQRSRSTNEFWDRSQQSGFLYFRGGDTDLGTNGIYLAMQQGYSGDSILFSIANGQIGMSQYPNYRIDGTQADVISMYYPDAQGNINIAPVDTMKRVLADWDFVQLMDGDTSYYGSNQKDSLLPLTATTLDSLLWRPGVIRLGDTIAFKRGYDPAGFGTGLRNTYKPQLQIHNKINGLDIYHWFYPYIWLRNNKGDWSFRTHNQDTEVDSLPHYYEIGVESYYKATPEADPDTSYRQVVRVSSQANSNAFVLYQDSLQLSDYTPDDTDSTITGAQIGAVFIPWTNGVVKLVSLDTLNAALSVAASTPNITFFDRYNTGDSIALNLNSTPDTAFADLSWLKVSITGDTLIQGTDTLFLPQGADSLGVVGGLGRIPIANGSNRAPVFSDSLVYLTATNRLGVGTNSPGGILDLHDWGSGALFRLWNRGTGESTMRFVAPSGGTAQVQWTDLSGWLGQIAVNSSTGMKFGVHPTGSTSEAGLDTYTRLHILRSGQLAIPAYTGTTFDNAPAKILNVDVSGNIYSTTAAQLGTFLSGIFQPAGSYDNYSSWTAGSSSGTRVVTSGSQLDFLGGDSDISTSISGSTVTFSIPNNAIQSAEISNGEVYPVDMAMSAPGAGQDEWLLSYEHTGGVWELVNPSSILSATIDIAVNNTVQANEVHEIDFRSTNGDITWSVSGTGEVDIDIPSNAIQNSEIQDGTIVATSKLSATGTPSSSTYLRGDNTWATVTASGDNIGTNGFQAGNIVLFNASASPVATQDNDFYWDAGTNVLTMDDLVLDGDTDGTQNITASQALSVYAANGLARLGNNSNSYMETQADGDILLYAPTSGDDIYLDANGTIFLDGGSVQITGSATDNLILNGTTVGSSSNGVLAIHVGTAPGSTVSTAAQLYSANVPTNAELRVLDGSGNTTTLSPHNFSGIPEGPSEELAWAFYSERDGKYVNVDMLKLARLVEQLTGEKLVYTGDTDDIVNKKK